MMKKEIENNDRQELKKTVLSFANNKRQKKKSKKKNMKEFEEQFNTGMDY